MLPINARPTSTASPEETHDILSRIGVQPAFLVVCIGVRCLHWNILLLLCFGRKHWFSRIACYEYLESTSSIYLFQTCSKFFHLRLVLLLGLLMYWFYGRFGRPSCLLRTNHHRCFPHRDMMICESCLFHQRGLSDQRSSRIKRGF